MTHFFSEETVPMLRIRNFMRLAAVLVGIAMLGAPTQAQAAFQLRYSLDGGANFSSPASDGLGGDLDGPGNGSILIFAGNVTITAHATVTTLSTPLSIFDLAVSGSLAAGVNLVVQMSLDNIPTAPPPQALTVNFSGSTNPALVSTAKTWVDSGNNLFTTGALNTPTAPNPGFIKAAVTTALGAVSNVSFSANPPYSVTAQIAVNNTGTVASSVSLDSNIQIAAPVPAGFVLALTGVPALGIGAWFRRRTMARLTA